MNDGITVVVPYYNEQQTIISTIERVAQQTLSAKCAIFVNSSSTDESSKLLDKWIEVNQNNYSTQFKNVFENTSNPGSSKNVGIRYTDTQWIAFMDCGQKFDSDWLYKQFSHAIKYNLDVIFGVVYLSGINWVDRCAVTQTYGYKHNRPCVPSTLVKKAVFDETGLFLEGRRSGYDLSWRIKVKKVIKAHGINKNVKIAYRGANYAPTLKLLFKKAILYAQPALGLDGYYIPYLYLICFTFFSYLAFLDIDFFIKLVSVYMITRIFIAPIIKSHGIIFFKEHPMEALFGLGIVGLLIDIGKITGYLKGIKDYIINKYKGNKNLVNNDKR